MDTELAIKAVDYALEYGLAMANSIIYATAMDTGADLLTCDRHFAEFAACRPFRQGLPMTGETGARRFFAPLIGLVLLFAALGPPVGGALFVPLAVVLKPPVAADALALSALIAALLGHTVMLVAAYVVGVGPAAATGFLYALWDAAAPERWPRSLVAAVIGGAMAYAVALRLAAIGASVEFTIRGRCRRFDRRMDRRVRFPAGSTGALAHAFVASGAIAGLVCGHGREPPRPDDAAGLGGRRTPGAA